MPAPANTCRTLITVPKAAERCALSPRYLWQAIAKGELNVIRFGKRATRIDEAELARFIESARGEGRSS
jgi:excisionase family DNA binding protein